MAIRRADLSTFTPPVAELPTPPDQYPAVVAARELQARVAAEHGQAQRALADARAALARHREGAAERLLDDLAAGRDAVDPDEAALEDAIDAAERRVAAAARAADLANIRASDALTAARADFSRRLRPALLAARQSAGEKLGAAVAANETLRRLAQHGSDHDPQAPKPWELTLPIPTAARLAELDDGLHAVFAEPAPLADRIPVRMLVTHMPYAQGEIVGLSPDEARNWCLALIAEPVRPEDVKRLGLQRMVRFDRPQRIRLTRNFPLEPGRVVREGAVETFDAILSSRAVNLGFGTTLGDADAE